MKRLFQVFVLACCSAVLALALAACGQSEKVESESSSSEPATTDAKEALAPSTEPYYVMVIGNDTRYGTVDGKDWDEDAPSYSDTMMLMRIDPVNYSIAICSIPRDTATNIHGEEGKMNDWHQNYGPEELTTAVGELFGVTIPYYFDTNFVGFVKMIDELGGVTVDVPMDMSGKDVLHGGKVYVSAGEQHLDGLEALVFSRMRKEYPDLGEACRQQNARQLVTRVISNVSADDPANAATYAQLLESISKTNMPEDRLEAEIRNFMEYDGEISFNTGTGPYWGDIDWTEMWRTPNDPDTYARLSEAMVDGTPLTDIVPNPM